MIMWVVHPVHDGQRHVLRLPHPGDRPRGPVADHRGGRPPGRDRRRPGHHQEDAARLDRADVRVDPRGTRLRGADVQHATRPIHVVVRAQCERRVDARHLRADPVRAVDHSGAAGAAVAPLDLRRAVRCEPGVPPAHPDPRLDRRRPRRHRRDGVGVVGSADEARTGPGQHGRRWRTRLGVRRARAELPDPWRDRRADRHVQPADRDLDPGVAVVPRPSRVRARLRIGQGRVLRRDRSRRGAQRSGQRDDRRRAGRAVLVDRLDRGGRVRPRAPVGPGTAVADAVGRRDEHHALRPRHPARRDRGQPRQQHHHRRPRCRCERVGDLALRRRGVADRFCSGRLLDLAPRTILRHGTSRRHRRSRILGIAPLPSPPRPRRRGSRHRQPRQRLGDQHRGAVRTARFHVRRARREQLRVGAGRTSTP